LIENKLFKPEKHKKYIDLILIQISHLSHLRYFIFRVSQLVVPPEVGRLTGKKSRVSAISLLPEIFESAIFSGIKHPDSVKLFKSLKRFLNPLTVNGCQECPVKKTQVAWFLAVAIAYL
jgi:hypothetical protein